MFDLRYHVASLAAVFLALIIGILVGVGISSGGFVKKGERKLLTDQIADLRNRLGAANTRAHDLSEAQKAGQTFVQDTYPALMAGRLRGKRVALVFVGSIDDGARSLIERTLSDASAAAPIRIRALKVPIDLGQLDALLAARPGLAQLALASGAGAIGRELGQEFVLGGQTPLWAALSSQLVAERLGGQQEPADGVVVVRSAEPQQGDTARFLAGLYSGLASQGVPAVGAEASTAVPSAVDAFAHAKMSTVDDLETAPGRLSLAALLAGASPGHYGLKDSAKNGLLPPIAPVPARAGG
jgi:Copper transport outer membrane protein, MctB